jgi:hypothetical protein
VDGSRFLPGGLRPTPTSVTAPIRPLRVVDRYRLGTRCPKGGFRPLAAHERQRREQRALLLAHGPPVFACEAVRREPGSATRARTSASAPARVWVWVPAGVSVPAPAAPGSPKPCTSDAAEVARFRSRITSVRSVGGLAGADILPGGRAHRRLDVPERAVRPCPDVRALPRSHQQAGAHVDRIRVCRKHALRAAAPV